MTLLDELVARVDALPAASRRDAIAEAMRATVDKKWIPNPGPQTDAYFCKADLLLYGGQGGGGKTDLLLGLAFNEHRASLIMRRKYTNLGGITRRAVRINGGRDGFAASPRPKFDLPDGRFIEFGAVQHAGDEEDFQGNPHDFIGFDEGTQLLEQQVRFLLGWNRAADDDLDQALAQRVRAVIASNPPLNAEGDWIVGVFGPWLDPMHENPAQPGELRWFLTDPDGRDMEVGGSDDCRVWDGEVYRPKSRTFIPAQLSDNPFLINTGYQAQLDALPEPIRSAVRDGNFMAAREDDPWQVIPTNWVLAANERWRQGRPENAAMTAIGLDVARGGRDETTLSPRYGKWFDELEAVPGRDTPDGPSVVALVVKTQRDGASINVDAIGVGSSVQDHLAQANIDYVPLNGASRSERATRDGKFGFVTKRSEMWWSMREALDPDYGMDIALPPDPKLQADLTAPTYEVRAGEPPKIYVEGKEDLKKRLGRSPDRGDAVVYAWAAGDVERMRNRKRQRQNAPTRQNRMYNPHRWRDQPRA